MAAIRANNPGAAVELMRPVLADFEKKYAGESARSFARVTPEQSSAYLADAAKTKREVVTIDAGWCRAQYVTGYALIDLERLPEALTAFQRLVAFAPQNSRYLNELGYIFMKQKKWKESLDAYRRSEVAADLSPDRAKEERCLALKGIGHRLVELGDLNAAEAAYRKCLNVNPQDTDSPRELEYIEEQRKLTVDHGQSVTRRSSTLPAAAVSVIVSPSVRTCAGPASTANTLRSGVTGLPFALTQAILVEMIRVVSSLPPTIR